MSQRAVLITCEHATAHVPRAFAHAFRGARQRALLQTHRAWDPGSQAVARRLCARLARVDGLLVAGPIEGKVTRLLVDLNRSARNPRVFSDAILLSPEEREALMLDYYLPHQRRVRAELISLLSRVPSVLHLGVHSFTPVLGGIRRNADIGILYDPKRRREKQFGLALRGELSGVRVRCNYPYRGTADGLTTMLRRELGNERYVGIELELNQSSLRIAESLAREASRALEAVFRSMIEDGRALHDARPRAGRVRPGR